MLFLLGSEEFVGKNEEDAISEGSEAEKEEDKDEDKGG